LQRDKKALHGQIVEAAILAPSAENAQPWHFRSDGERLTVCLDRQHAFASDVDSMLSLTGLGACIENAVIAARECGFEAVVTVNDGRLNTTEKRFVPLVIIDFAEADVQDPLHAFLAERRTCRRMDGARRVSRDELVRLSSSTERFPSVRVDWLIDPAEISEVARLIGQGNRIRFEHRPFHGELYQHLRFARAEAQQTRDGLDVATLQLPFGVASIMRFLRSWPRMRAANLFGFSRAVARQAAQEVMGSGAVGILTVDGSTVAEFLQGGRALERLWLTATSCELALHPTASLAVFLAHAERTGLDRLLPAHAKAARKMADRFYRLCPALRGRVVQIVFRVGHAAQLGPRSLRRPARSVLDFK
jgi:hypothetical protein